MWIQREIEPVLRSLAESRPAVVVTGARQSGKTSLLRALQTLLEELSGEREDTCLYIVDQNLATYEALRPKKGGRPVALLEGSLCRGCLVTLPLSDSQRARSGSGLSFCTHCGRILYAKE